MATSIDDNEADEKSDKSMCQLINIRCIREESVNGTEVIYYGWTKNVDCPPNGQYDCCG